MDKVKIKTIGVLREREGVTNDNGNGVCRVMTLSSAIADAGGGGGGGNVAIVGQGEFAKDDSGGGVAPANRTTTAGSLVRQLPKMSPLDLAGILNCKRRLEWTKEWLKKNQAELLSKENLRKEILFRNNEIYHFNCFFNITERQFRYLVTKLSPVISSYEPHRKKKSFSAEERIAITLKYLATGEVHSCRNYCFRASKPVILKMIANICLNIYELLKDPFVSLPKTDEQWQNVANEFQRKHRMLNCAGNLAMQQIRFHSSSRVEEQIDFINKQPLIFTSIVDINDNFLYIDIEKTRAAAVDEIYEKSTIRQLIESYEVKLPKSYEAQEDICQSYYFASKNDLPLKPYLLNGPTNVPNNSKVTYNNVMNMVNKHTENALRMLANIFPILSQPLRIDEENGRKIILGCVALYNFLRKTERGFFMQTKNITNITTRNDWLDDDCILIASEEEHGSNEDYAPKVTLTNCFESLYSQKGDSLLGAAKRDHVIKRLAETYGKLQ